MYDETQLKIIDATMTLIIDKGYSGATTKEIAKLAGVNESTIFRRFEGKKEIVIAAMDLPQWNPGLSESDFTYQGDLEEDLTFFSEIYMRKVTPQMVKVSIGLRSAELQGAALPGIMKVPMVFKNVLINYFTQMIADGKMCGCNVESISLQFLAMNFGFVFLDASFGNKLIGVSKAEYIRNSIQVFVSGIRNK
ncbi:MAG: TetR/AcrR family transcriptional regulator [Lachnospiraceae bacterium]|nr:TetR/AcrR family transcriptional regulator [Lachnospiraceae bacterium]